MPDTESAADGAVVPMPNRPWVSRRSAVSAPWVGEDVEINNEGEVEVPVIESTAPGEVDPMRPKRPPEVRWAKVVVALGPVDDAMVKSGVPEGRARLPATESLAQGEEVPIPSLRFVASMPRKFAESMVEAAE